MRNSIKQTTMHAQMTNTNKQMYKTNKYSATICIFDVLPPSEMYTMKLQISQKIRSVITSRNSVMNENSY